MYSYGSPHTAAQKQDDQHERTFSSYVRIQVVVLKTCLGRWTIGRSGERGSGISVLPARYDDDDDIMITWSTLYSVWIPRIDFKVNETCDGNDISGADWVGINQSRLEMNLASNLIANTFVTRSSQTLNIL